ncbi:MAG: EAL domain-containing protein [Beijerinckiaceae bacterium]
MKWDAPIVAAGIGLVVGTIGAGGLMASGAPLAGAGAGGVLAAGTISAGWLLYRHLKGLSGEVATLRQTLLDERERNDAFFTELQRRTVESPALVWRAATADIEVLGSLLRDLARTLGDHERRLDAMSGPAAVAPQISSFSAPAASAPPREMVVPETDVELPPHEHLSLAPAPANTAFVMGELRSTLAVALASERLELTLQPVVQLPQRRIAGYEAGLRLKADEGVGEAPDLGRIATVTGMRADLDRALLDRAIQALRVLKARNGDITMRCAVAAASLGDDLVLSLLRGQLATEPDFAPALRLEVHVEELAVLSPDRLADFRRIGMTIGVFSRDLSLDPARLAQLGARHLRLSVRDLQAALSRVSPSATIHPADLPELLARRGIDLIIDGIAGEDEVRELLDYPVSFGQGPLFGVARGVKPDRLRAAEPGGASSAEVKPATAKTAPEQARDNAPPAKPTRPSFRSLLRRA